MPNEDAANQTKHVHHVAKPNKPRYTSVVNTLIVNRKWNNMIKILFTSFPVKFEWFQFLKEINTALRP